MVRTWDSSFLGTADAPLVLSESVFLEKIWSFCLFAPIALMFSIGAMLPLLLCLGLGIPKEIL